MEHHGGPVTWRWQRRRRRLLPVETGVVVVEVLRGVETCRGEGAHTTPVRTGGKEERYRDRERERENEIPVACECSEHAQPETESARPPGRAMPPLNLDLHPRSLSFSLSSAPRPDQPRAPNLQTPTSNRAPLSLCALCLSTLQREPANPTNAARSTLCSCKRGFQEYRICTYVRGWKMNATRARYTASVTMTIDITRFTVFLYMRVDVDMW